MIIINKGDSSVHDHHLMVIMIVNMIIFGSGQTDSVKVYYLRRWQVREGIAGGPKRQNSVQIHESICFHSELSLLL